MDETVKAPKLGCEAPTTGEGRARNFDTLRQNGTLRSRGGSLAVALTLESLFLFSGRDGEARRFHQWTDGVNRLKSCSIL
jgi:hypothetical protein